MDVYVCMKEWFLWPTVQVGCTQCWPIFLHVKDCHAGGILLLIEASLRLTYADVLCVHAGKCEINCPVSVSGRIMEHGWV